MGGGLRGKSPWSTSIHCWGGSHLTRIQEGFASEKKTFAVNTTQRAGEGCDPSSTAKQSSTCCKEAMRP